MRKAIVVTCVLAVFALALPACGRLGAQKSAAQETAAISTLMQIKTAQSMYQAVNMKYGTFKELADKGTLDVSEGAALNAYVFSMDKTVAEGKFTCTAIPVDKSRGALKVGEDGVLYINSKNDGTGEWKEK